MVATSDGIDRRVSCFFERLAPRVLCGPQRDTLDNSRYIFLYVTSLAALRCWCSALDPAHSHTQSNTEETHREIQAMRYSEEAERRVFREHCEKKYQPEISMLLWDAVIRLRTTACVDRRTNTVNCNDDRYEFDDEKILHLRAENSICCRCQISRASRKPTFSREWLRPRKDPGNSVSSL